MALARHRQRAPRALPPTSAANNNLVSTLTAPNAQVAACLQAVQLGSATELRLQAHALKGTCAALCLPQLRQVCPWPPPSTPVRHQPPVPHTRGAPMLVHARCWRLAGAEAPPRWCWTSLCPLTTHTCLRVALPAQRCAELERSSQVPAESAGWLAQARVLSCVSSTEEQCCLPIPHLTAGTHPPGP